MFVVVCARSFLGTGDSSFIRIFTFGVYTSSGRQAALLLGG